MKSSVFFIVWLLFLMTGSAQVDNPYLPYFQEAYSKYPSVPQGLLEAVAYTNTRLQHLTPAKTVSSCQDLPQYFGVMGLVEDGKGYFNNSLQRVAQLSGFSVAEIKADPRINILAYAAAYARMQESKRVVSRNASNHSDVVAALSEIPQDGSDHNQFACDQQFYAILKEIERPHSRGALRSRQVFNYESIFGKERYQELTAPALRVTTNRGLNNSDTHSPFTCTQANGLADYANALWASANSNNYGARNGAPVEYIAIHTIQGSYASAISWFKNRRARVSAHYVVRSSDGQITQMVCESDKAYHVRPYKEKNKVVENYNGKSIGIEHEGFINDGHVWYTDAMYRSSATLVKDLCKRHGINPLQAFGGPPISGIRSLGDKCYRIKGHQNFKGNDHIDPGPHWNWDRFYRLINPTPKPEKFTAKRGEIFDPGGKSGTYPDQARRTYLIQPKGSNLIKLRFMAFDMEGDTKNFYDYLDIYDGTDPNGKFLGRFTGSKIPGELEAQSGSVFIEFRSDCQINKSGWHIRYISERGRPSCPPVSDLKAEKPFALGATLTWAEARGANHYLVRIRRRNLDNQWTYYQTNQPYLTATGLGANALYQWQVQAVCGQGDSSAVMGKDFVTPPIVSQSGSPQSYTIRLTQGLFHDSGSTHGSYASNEAYVYRILPPTGRRIELDFEEFETEEGEDIMTIYDGTNTNASVIGKYSGTDSPGRIVSSGRGLTITFTSDRRTVAKGWKASWKTLGVSPEEENVVVNPEKPTPTPGETPTTPTTPTTPSEPSPDLGPFSPDLTYSNRNPETTPKLNVSYNSSFKFSFNDRDRSARGLANRFYNIAQMSASGFRSNSRVGMLYDDFDKGLSRIWNSAAGTWTVLNGRLIQSDESLGNTNLHTDLTQVRDDVYVYHWQARMTGSGNNKRSGIHFFASRPELPDRGNSYFVWFREANTGDKIEIYKTINDQFDLKVRRTIELESGKVYDYKVIYNPTKGRMEVYINNRFTASWNDPNPLRTGKGFSFRSGNCRLIIDHLRVYKSRGSTVEVNVGKGLSNDVVVSDQPNTKVQVSSLVVDRNIRWSPVSQVETLINPEETAPEESPTLPPTTDNGTPSTPTPAGTFLRPSYAGDFDLRFDPTNSFYLVSYFSGNQWTTNPNAGFIHEDFNENTLAPGSNVAAGEWKQQNGVLAQTSEAATNSNLYLPLSQQNSGVYLYQWKARIVSVGNNKRFGIHIFCSDGSLTNRGDSYMIWFRNNEDRADRVEIYRTDNNQYHLKKQNNIQLEKNTWYNCKVLYDGRSGKITIFLNDVPVLSWKDERPPLASGKHISFRTGGSHVQFDDLKVFQQTLTGSETITVGTADLDMLPFRSRDKQLEARVLLTAQDSRGKWQAIRVEETKIRK